MKPKKQTRSAYPEPLPCGCTGAMKNGKAEVIVLENKSRVCKCGRIWNLVWQEVKKP